MGVDLRWGLRSPFTLYPSMRVRTLSIPLRKVVSSKAFVFLCQADPSSPGRTEPGSPGIPGDPCAPGCPAGPLAPVCPLGPCGPVKPLGPRTPGSPFSPFGPEGPRGPGSPFKIASCSGPAAAKSRVKRAWHPLGSGLSAPHCARTTRSTTSILCSVSRCCGITTAINVATATNAAKPMITVSNVVCRPIHSAVRLIVPLPFVLQA